MFQGKTDTVTSTQISGPGVPRHEELGHLEAQDSSRTAEEGISAMDNLPWKSPPSTSEAISAVRESERGGHWWEIGLLSIFTGTSSRS